MINFESLFKITYGLYIVSSGDRIKANGFISNSVFQVTAEPPKFAICCNKLNFTAGFIHTYGVFSVSVLDQNASSETIGKFGYKSGRDLNKMEGSHVIYGDTNVPVVLDDSIAYLECRVVETIDVGTHLIFIGELLNAEVTDESKDPLTYSYYRQVKKGFAPKNAPTYLDKSKIGIKPGMTNSRKYKCPACGYIYDEAVEKIKFSDLPGDWVCPICGTEKSDFMELV
jgi:flavin reductase (DIM6/NTAB) family NADH-FMN oxidoreductase RutF/rubredoxin